MRNLFLAAAAMGLAVTGTSAMAAQHKRDSNAAGKKEYDPNRKICRTEHVIGSRLAVHRTCLTAAQWDQLEHDQRQTIERVQAFGDKHSN